MTRISLQNIGAWIAVALAASAAIAYGISSARSHRENAIGPDGCFAYRQTPEVLAIATDITDPLEDLQPRRWHATVEAAVGSAPQGTRLLFTTIRDTVPAEMTVDVGPCTPATSESPQSRNVRQAVAAAIAHAQAQVAKAREMKRSPIRRTLLAIAADPTFAGARQRVVVLQSDLLEMDGKGASAYRRKGFALPQPVGKPLSGITLYLSVLRNTRDERFQTPALIEAWVAWGRAAGATVVVNAPWLGYRPEGAV
jgi:hypothetical protein